jgi:hypothetical protein
LLLWVHWGEVASCADIARRSRLPFSAADLDAFVEQIGVNLSHQGASARA